MWEKTDKKQDKKTVLAVYKPAGIVCTEDKREKEEYYQIPELSATRDLCGKTG